MLALDFCVFMCGPEPFLNPDRGCLPDPLAPIQVVEFICLGTRLGSFDGDGAASSRSIRSRHGQELLLLVVLGCSRRFANSRMRATSSSVNTRQPFRSRDTSFTRPSSNHRFNVIGATPIRSAP